MLKVDFQDIKETSIWQLYEKGRNYQRMMGVYTDTDRNYRFYNGNQWEGANLGGVEPIQKNFIKPIVKYKVAVIHDNLYAAVYSSQNYEDSIFQREATRYCDMLNAYALRVWERDKMDFKGRRVTKDSAINDEGIIYVNFDEEKMFPVNEIVKKNDIYYGNENDDDIQSQPYILIRRRMPVSSAIELAEEKGVSAENLRYIVGDSDNHEESGAAAKFELDDQVTVVYKMYKQKGTVHYSIATRFCEICEDVDTGLSLYPVAHFIWEEKEGSARGEGEVRYLIPNQIEVNKTEMRRVLVVKQQAYPRLVVDESKISNPAAVEQVGAVIKASGQTVDDVHKIVGSIKPAQMSADVKLLQDDLIQMSRDLAGAGETATGEVDPEAASGRAILAVQQASQAPMTEQKESYKNFIEDLARIWLEYLIVYAVDGVNLEEKYNDPQTGEEAIRIVNVPQSVLRKLQATVKIDVTPKSPLDKFAQEQTIEGFLVNGLLSAERVGELEIYAELLDDDSVAPKQKIKEAVALIKERQAKIAQMDAAAQLMQQRASQFLMEDPDAQVQQISDAQAQLMAAQGAEEEAPGEDLGFELEYDKAAYENMENELDEEVEIPEEE